MNKKDLLLYAVTDRLGSVEELLKKTESALQGGVTMVQLREKGLPFDDFVKEALLFKKLCAKFCVPLIINDNADVASAVGADGVHVGAEDAPVSEIRARFGKNFIIGATAKTVEQAKRAQAQGADYLGVGAVFASSTKTNALRITKETLKEITAAADIPAVAIGGINLDNIDEICGSGVAGVAVVSALFGAKDVQLAAKLLKQKAIKITGGSL